MTATTLNLRESAPMETLRWKIGDVVISRIIESPHLGDTLFMVMPEAVPEKLRAIPWLAPHFAHEDGRMKAHIQAFVIDTGRERIMIDTCVGNHKHRPRLPQWHMQTFPFLENLRAAGYDRHAIDTVLCTHMHGDHVGWNTMLVDGKWVPTFPNARYLFGEIELAHARASGDFEGASFGDSILPVLDAGLAVAVAADFTICPEVRLIPTHGHTPGHVSVLIESRGERAFITGDCIHHPSQFVHLEWRPKVDNDPERAGETRRAVLEHFADTPTLFIGTHFGGPTAGRVVRDGAVYRLAVD